MSEVPCRRCDGSATIACMACMIPLCKFCSDRHSIHRRYRKHLRGSLEELRKRLVSEKCFVDILVEEKEKRDEIKTRRFKDALEKLRTKVAREKALRNDKRRIRDLESNGRRYEGEISPKSMREMKIRDFCGYGRLVAAQQNRTVYEGSWFSSDFHGRGTWHFDPARRKNGDFVTWEGSFRRGSPIGLGTRVVERRRQKHAEQRIAKNEKFDNPKDLVGSYVQLGLRVASLRYAIVCEYDRERQLWLLQYLDFNRERKWVNLIGVQYRIIDSIAKLGIISPYIEEKHIVTKEETYHGRFNNAASYILNRKEDRRLSCRRNSQIEHLNTESQKKDQWIESMVQMPRVFPEKGIHDELVDVDLYSNTGKIYVSRGNTSPLRRLLDRHRREIKDEFSSSS